MGEALVEVQDDLDKSKFYKEYIDLLTRPTPPPPGTPKNQDPIASPEVMRGSR